MKNTFTKRCLLFTLLITLLSCCFLSSCSISSNYVGTYESVFVDSQNDADTISFELTINEDNTFILTRYSQNSSRTFSGYYKSYTESNSKMLLCIIEHGYTWNTTYPNAWNPYFSLCKLDDGTIMATPGTTSSNYDATTAFGSGSITKITLVLFAKV